MSRKIQKLAPIVEKLIKNDPTLADNNDRLIANLWYQHLKDMGVTNTYKNVKIILSFIVSALPSAESITRTSRKLQRDKPELQGKEWSDRQVYSKKYRKSINKITV